MKVDGLDICYIRNAETRFEEEKKCFISNCEQKKVEMVRLVWKVVVVHVQSCMLVSTFNSCM